MGFLVQGQIARFLDRLLFEKVLFSLDRRAGSSRRLGGYATPSSLNITSMTTITIRM